MIGNLKALGLALVAVFALSAMAASAAFAHPQGQLTSPGPVTLDINEIAGETNALTAFKETVTCAGSTFTGHKVMTQAETLTREEMGEATHDLLPIPSTTATITAHYNEPACTSVGAAGTHKATVTMNGCDYVFHVGETATDVNKKLIADTYNVTADVVCPTGKSIILHVYFAKANENVLLCEVTVGPQVGLAGPTVKTITTASPHDLEIHGTFKNIAATKSGTCGHEATATAEFHINATVKGTNNLGQPAAITISDVA